MSQNLKNCCQVGLSTSIVSSSDPLSLQDLKDEELSNVAERILQSINAAFERVNSMDEFDIIPQESQSNRSPVIHIGQKLALESWCVPFVYVHSFRHFLSLIQLPGRNGRPRSSSSITAKESLNGSGNEFFDGKNKVCYSQLSEVERTQRALTLSRVLVLLNPDLTLAWNYRREAFQQGYALLRHELDLITLTASRKPKCPEGFSYRRWILQNHLNGEKFRADQSFELFQSEARAVETAAIKYFSNYHAWNYRHFLLELYLMAANVPNDQKIAILEYERGVSDDWKKTHVSDHSGLHYRQRLLEYIGFGIAKEKSSEDTVKVYFDELEENGKLILYYPGHECLWYHRRALLKRITENIISAGDKANKDGENLLVIVKKNESQLVQLVSTENESASENVKSDARLENTNQLAFVSQEYLSLNILYSERHVKWLKNSFEL